LVLVHFLKYLSIFYELRWFSSLILILQFYLSITYIWIMKTCLHKDNINKIRCLLHCIFFSFGDTLISNNIPFGVMSGVIFSTHKSMMSLLFKTEYMPRAVVRFVNTFNCLVCNWVVKDEWKVTWWDGVRCSCIT